MSFVLQKDTCNVVRTPHIHPARWRKVSTLRKERKSINRLGLRGFRGTVIFRPVGNGLRGTPRTSFAMVFGSFVRGERKGHRRSRVSVPRVENRYWFRFLKVIRETFNNFCNNKDSSYPNILWKWRKLIFLNAPVSKSFVSFISSEQYVKSFFKR